MPVSCLTSARRALKSSSSKENSRTRLPRRDSAIPAIGMSSCIPKFAFSSVTWDVFSEQLDAAFGRMALVPCLGEIMRTFGRRRLAQARQTLAHVRQLLHQPVVELQVLDTESD